MLTVATALGVAVDEDLAAMRDMIRTMLARDCPIAAVRAHLDGAGELDRLLAARAAELGVTAVAMPEAHGGLGLGVAGFAMVAEELGHALAPGGLGTALAAALWLAEAAGDDAATLIPALAQGEIAVAVAADLTPDRTAGVGEAVVDVAAPRRLATIMAADGSIALVGFEDSQHAPTWDHSRALVLPSLAAAPEIRVVVPDVLARLETLVAVAIAADSLGLTRRLFDMTLGYLKAREQFGRPIGSFQALKHRMVDIALAIERASGLIDQAVAAVAAHNPASARMWALLAKADAADTAVASASEAIQFHGGIGFAWEHDCHLFLKRAQLNAALFRPSDSCRDEAARLLAEASAAERTTMELPA